MSVNGTLVEAKMCTFTLESRHFIFKKCPIYTHDGASAKFSTNSQEKDYSAEVCFGSLKFIYCTQGCWKRLNEMELVEEQLGNRIYVCQE